MPSNTTSPSPLVRHITRLVALLAVVAGTLSLAPTPASAAPLLVANPNPVPIPFGQTSDTFDLTWDSGTGQDVELVFQHDNQPPDPPQKQVSKGTLLMLPIGLGEVITITMQPSGGGRPLIAPITVTGIAGDPVAPDCTAAICAFEPSVDAHGTWATATVQVADVVGVTIEVTLGGTPLLKVPMTLGAGSATADLEPLDAGKLYEYTIFVVDHLGHETAEATGAFTTLKRIVQVHFDTIEVIDDSDDLTAGDFTVQTNVDDAGWTYWNTVDGGHQWDSETFHDVGIVVDASGVATPVKIELFIEDDDKDITSGLCSDGSHAGTTGENSCYSWLTLSTKVDTKTGMFETFTASATMYGGNSDDLEVRVYWSIVVTYG